MNDFWNAKIYLKFSELRTKPSQDLLEAIHHDFQPHTVYDLGCGTGNSTILLKMRWPNAKVVGIDSSLAMLKEARNSYSNIDFVNGNIERFTPTEKIDCLFANASLQWLDNHNLLIPKLLTNINSGGILAIQMPNNFHMPSHQAIIQILQNKSTWQPYLKKLRYGILSEPLYQPNYYYDLLTQHKVSSLQLWETKYFQEMENHQEIFDWVKGTSLNPILSMMNSENQREFKNEYIKAITPKYKLQVNKKILFPFKRIFIICSV